MPSNWIGTADSKLVRVKITANELTVLRQLYAPGLHAINDILPRPQESLIIAADNEVGSFDKDGVFHKFNKMRFNNSVDNITVDYEGNIWFSSSRMGIAKLTRNSFVDIFDNAGIEQQRVVNSICQYQGITYIATDNGLLALQGQKQVHTRLSELLKTTRTRHIMVDSKNNLWLSTYSDLGLIKYSPNGSIKTFTRQDGMPHERCRTTLEASDGTIYAGTRDGLAIIRNDKVVKTLNAKDGLVSPQILCLLENVAQYSRQLALAMGWSEQRAENLYRVAMLHDVGKVVIPEPVLNKRGPLTYDEYKTMKEHTDIGASILQEITLFPTIALGARSHHERYDGKGYGHQLKGEEIPLEARIIAVADTFDAMNSTRVVRICPRKGFSRS